MYTFIKTTLYRTCMSFENVILFIISFGWSLSLSFEANLPKERSIPRLAVSNWLLFLSTSITSKPAVERSWAIPPASYNCISNVIQAQAAGKNTLLNLPPICPAPTTASFLIKPLAIMCTFLSIFRKN